MMVYSQPDFAHNIHDTPSPNPSRNQTSGLALAPSKAPGIPQRSWDQGDNNWKRNIGCMVTGQRNNTIQRNTEMGPARLLRNASCLLIRSNKYKTKRIQKSGAVDLKRT